MNGHCRPEGQHRVEDREHDGEFREAHEHLIRQPSDVTCRDTRDRTEQNGDEERRTGHEHRQPCAMDDAAEQVAAETVSAE